MELTQLGEEVLERNAQRVLPEALGAIVQRLVVALKPERIFLFGSYVYGEPNGDTDVDLLVIVSHSDELSYRRARWAYQALRGISMPTDVIVMTRDEVRHKQSVRSSLVSQVLREWKLLYGA